MRVDIDRMIKETEGVDSHRALAEFLTAKGVDVCERTLYRWKKGTHFNKNNVIATAEALDMELRDIVILHEAEAGLDSLLAGIDGLIKEVDDWAEQWIATNDALKEAREIGEHYQTECNKLREIVSRTAGTPDETPVGEWARCSEISDEDIDLLPDRIADDEQKESLKQRKDELAHNVLECLMENHFTDTFRGVVQDMLDPVDSNGRSLKGIGGDE